MSEKYIRIKYLPENSLSPEIREEINLKVEGFFNGISTILKKSNFNKYQFTISPSSLRGEALCYILEVGK